MKLVCGGPTTELVGRDDPDGSLLLRARTDPRAFGELYDRTHEGILRFFLVRTRCPVTSADLCAETFAGALEGLQRFDPAKGTGRGWLTGIAKHTLHQYLRREDVSRRARDRLGIRFSGHDVVDLDRIDALVDHRPRVARLAVALHTLPEATRLAVVLRIVDELPYDEIARRLGTTTGNARVRVCRGLVRLEALVGDADD
jgi:RNA polymerase sigma-70 factor (ECF subfamily)